MARQATLCRGHTVNLESRGKYDGDSWYRAEPAPGSNSLDPDDHHSDHGPNHSLVRGNVAASLTRRDRQFNSLRIRPARGLGPSTNHSLSPTAYTYRQCLCAHFHRL